MDRVETTANCEQFVLSYITHYLQQKFIISMIICEGSPSDINFVKVHQIIFRYLAYKTDTQNATKYIIICTSGG